LTCFSIIAEGPARRTAAHAGRTFMAAAIVVSIEAGFAISQGKKGWYANVG